MFSNKFVHCVWAAMFICISINKCVEAYNQNPSVFVDVECISFIDRLRHGFNIHLPKSFTSSFHDMTITTMLYATAIPLSPNGHPAVRKVLTSEEYRDGIINIGNLLEKSWYYVCVEFEIVKQFQRHGNTSTSCKLVRTLDSMGTAKFTTVSDVTLEQTTDQSMEFSFRSDTNFPLFYDAYLSHGPSEVITFFVDASPENASTGIRTPTVSILIENLQPDVNYGQLCIAERPLVTAYTAMGREVQLDREISTHCFMEALKTLAHNRKYRQDPAYEEQFGHGNHHGSDADYKYRDLRAAELDNDDEMLVNGSLTVKGYLFSEGFMASLAASVPIWLTVFAL